MFRRLALSLLVLAVLAPTLAADPPVQGGTVPVPLPLFPQNNWWNIDISNAPTVADSTQYYAKMGGALKTLHPDFGGLAADPDYIYGIPFVVVDGAQTKLTVDFIDEDVREECDGVDHNTNQPFPFYPIPAEAITQMGWVEGGPPGNVDLRDDSDRHLLIVDKTNNHLYELYNVWYNGAQWEAYSGAFFNMSTNNRRTETWTSADAAGLAMLPGLVRYDEVYGPDEIRHAFRFTVSQSSSYVYPASHDASSGSGSFRLPMGARIRLKPGTNISGYPAPMQKIFRAFKKYGLIMADNGSNMYVSGTFDTRWDNDVLNPAFGGLKVSDFEVIQLGWRPSITFTLTLPATTGANDMLSATLTAYDQNYNVATGYTGTVHFTSTDGAATLPVDYTFTGGDAGTHTFTNGFILRTPGSQIVTFTDTVTNTITGSAGVAVGPPTPTNLVATATTTTNVGLSWTASAGATQYEIVRNGLGSPVVTASTSYNDTTVTAGNVYVYKVRALDAASHASAYSVPDVATTFTFTDDPLIVASTLRKAVHITELRTVVNALRAVGGLGAASFTDPSLTNVVIRTAHVQELRTALTEGRNALGLSSLAFTDASLVAGTTRVKAAHVQELRSGLK